MLSNYTFSELNADWFLLQLGLLSQGSLVADEHRLGLIMAQQYEE